MLSEQDKAGIQAIVDKAISNQFEICKVNAVRFAQKPTKAILGFLFGWRSFIFCTFVVAVASYNFDGKFLTGDNYANILMSVTLGFLGNKAVSYGAKAFGKNGGEQ